MIGPNGAGKTTLFNLVTGVYEPTGGDILFDGSSITGLEPHQITRTGIARTFQTLRLFLNMTVRENVMAAAYGHTKAGAFRSMLRTPGMRREEQEIRELAEKRLAFFGERLMGYRWDQPAYSLSYANRRRLEIARATATNPSLLLLDEPAAGMNPEGDAGDHGVDRAAPERRWLHDPRDRARHARRRGDLRPRHRPRPRRQDRGGLVRGGRDLPAGRRGVPRHRVGWRGNEQRERDADPPARRHQHLLRPDPHPSGREHRRGRGRARLPPRRERVGQVDDAEDDSRHRPPAHRTQCGSPART